MAASSYQHPSLRNLVPELQSKFELDDIGAAVVEEYQRNRESRSEWEEKHKKWTALYYQTDRPVNADRWSGASDESVPSLTEACHQYHTRLYSQMFSGRRLVQSRPTGRSSKADLERAERIDLHMTWQLTVKDRGYRRDKDRLLLGLPVHGTVFTKTYRDTALNKNVTRNVRAIDLMLPYGMGPRNIEDIENKTEIIPSTVNHTALLAQNGFLSAVGTPTERLGDWLTSPDLELENTVGQFEPEGIDDFNRPVLLLESHRLIDLDGDGIAEPYIVTVDAETHKVLRIAIRWETDEAGNPIPSQWYNAKQPIEYYTQYNFYENPDGVYGLGLGHILGEINKATNRLLREIIDAGMMATVGNMSGFVNKGLLGVQGGPLELELGRFKGIDSNVDDISKGIFQFQFPGPAQAILAALEMLLMRADRLGLNTEAVTGQLERALQPTTILALLEESSRGFGSVSERVIYAWGDELRKHYRLNRLHMDPQEYFSVLDIAGSMVDQSITRDDYAADMQIEPAVDPSMKTEKERIQKAQIEYQTMAQNPLVMMDPTGLSFYNVTKRYLQSLRVDNIDEILPNPMLLAMQGVNVPAMMTAMMGMGKDETGLTDGSGGQANPAGVAGGQGNGAGFPPLAGAIPGGEMEDGSNLGGYSPGAGSEGSR